MVIFGRRLNPETFEQWCQFDEPAADTTTLNYGEFFKAQNAREQVADEVIGVNYAREVQMIAADTNKKRLVVNTVGSVNPLKSFVLDFSDIFMLRQLTPDTPSLLYRFDHRRTENTQIRRGIIRELYIGPEIKDINLEECCIGIFEIRPDSEISLKLRDCWIGHLVLTRASIHNMVVEGGSIRNFSCPAPDGANPFTGSVSFASDTEFPTSSKSQLLEGAQSYRSMRAHLEKLENAPGANLMRSLELKTERRDDHGLTKLVSWAYGTFANYGLSPGRPLLYVFALYVATAEFIFGFDGGSPGADTGYYTGWQTNLIDPGERGVLYRSLVLPLQSIFNPFAHFGVRRLVVPATSLGQLVLLIQGVFTYVLFAMTIFGIRRRFKLH